MISYGPNRVPGANKGGAKDTAYEALSDTARSRRASQRNGMASA